MRIGDKLIVHLDEAIAGEGAVDWSTLLSRLAKLPPHTPVIVEHLPPKDVPRAKAFVDQMLRQLGLEFAA